MKKFFQNGFSLVEIMIVIAIMGIIVSVVSSQFSQMRKLQILKSTSDDIVSVLNKARSQTLASLNLKNYGVHFETNRIVIFTGTTYSSNDASNEIISISSPVTISNISLTSGATEFYFNRLTGTTSKTGTITISIPPGGSLSKIITISATGVVSIN